MKDLPDKDRLRKEIGEDTLFSILESMDEVIYVADPDTHQLLYLGQDVLR